MVSVIAAAVSVAGALTSIAVLVYMARANREAKRVAEQAHATRDHSVHFNGPISPISLADIEHWREQQSKMLGLRDL